MTSEGTNKIPDREMASNVRASSRGNLADPQGCGAGLVSAVAHSQLKVRNSPCGCNSRAEPDVKYTRLDVAGAAMPLGAGIRQRLARSS